MLMRLISTLAMAVLFFAMSIGPASAHAILVQSSPAASGTVAGPAVAFELHFNSRIDAKLSTLTLIRADKSTTALTAADDAPADVLKTKADLTPGDYVLRWQVLAVDGHITRGDVPFTVSGK
jgi:methionine-rich copper-binding protein CopC